MRAARFLCLLLLLFPLAVSATERLCSILSTSLAEGRSLPTVFVVTHQERKLVEATLKTLCDDPRYQGLPVVFINSAKYSNIGPEQNSSLPERSAVVQSKDGHLWQGRLLAEEVHLAGGNCGMCLRNTVQDLLRTFLKSDNGKVKFVVHQSLTYGDFGTNPERPAPLMDGLLPPELLIATNKRVTMEIRTADQKHYTVKVPGYPQKQIEFEVVP